MRKRKNVLIIICCILLFSSLLATACGQGSTEPAGGGGAAEPAEQEEAPADPADDPADEPADEAPAVPPGEYAAFDWFITVSAIPLIWDLSQPILRAITDNTGAAPNIILPAADADTVLNLKIAAADLPDLITMGNRDLYTEMIQAGMIWNMGEFMETYKPDSHILRDFPQDIKEVLIVRDGGWYAYPSHMNSPDAIERFGFPEPLQEYFARKRYYNHSSIFMLERYADAVGVDVASVNTEEALLDFMQLLHDAELTNEEGADVFTFVLHAGIGYHTGFFHGLRMHFGVLPYDEDINFRSFWFAPEMTYLMRFLNTCFRRGFICESTFMWDQDTMTAVGNAGRIAVFQGGIAAFGAAHRDMDWATPGPIITSSGMTPVFPVWSGVSAGWLQTFVTKNNNYNAVIARFIDYMSSPEGMLTHIYGFENEDFFLDDYGMLHRTELGAERREDGITGNFGFYGFHHVAFQRSMEFLDLTYERGIATEMGSSPLSFVYEATYFPPPTFRIEPGSDLDFIRNEVNNFVVANLYNVIMAPDDETFESMWDDFREELENLGLRYLDERANVYTQEALRESGVDLSIFRP